MIWDPNGTYRILYISRFSDAVYVLHAFHKKTQATPEQEINLARVRYKQLKRQVYGGD